MRTALAATALGITLTTAGLISCAGDAGPPITPAPAPSGTPVFASDEEALAAAEGAYTAYLDVSNTVGEGGWSETSRLAEVAADAALADELESAMAYATAGYRQVGDSTFDSMILQQFDQVDIVRITVYLCLDVSEVDVLNQDGDSVVSPDRPPRQALEVDIQGAADALKLTRSEAWSGANFC